jgi:hypothetical protein
VFVPAVAGDSDDPVAFDPECSLKDSADHF